jgi:hypothetical protein
MLFKNLLFIIFLAAFLAVTSNIPAQKAFAYSTDCYSVTNGNPDVPCTNDTACHTSCGASYVCAEAVGAGGVKGKYCVLPLGIAKFVDNKVGGYELVGSGLNLLISNALFAVASIIGLILFAQLIYGGIQYMTSSGDDKRLQAAQKVITNSLIGLVIVIMAYWIVRILGIIFGIEFLSPKFEGP